MIDLKNIDLDRKIGQLIFVGFEGTEITDDIRGLIREYKVGNIILFERNCKNPKQIFKLIKDLQAYAMKEIGISLFIAIDQENGMVTRIYEGVTHFPGNMAVAATKNVKYGYEVGKCMGEELNALGINFNLAPCTDINNNPENPIIGVRSYGENKELVKKFAVSMINGMQKQGIISTVKHFPGHGDTNIDSHLGLPKVDYRKERLNAVELYPFKESIKAGVKAVMTAHIIFSAYEEENIPATLSKNILTGLLRDELDFKGLIMTDCMEMNAIKDYYGTEKGAKLAIEAGADLVCISHTKEKQIRALKLIKQAIEEEDISIKRIDESVERILREKKKLKVTVNYEEALKKLYKKENIKLSRKISEESMTIVKNEDIIPIANKKVLVVSIEEKILTGVEGERKSLSIGEIFKEKLKTCVVEYKSLELNIDDKEIVKLKGIVANYDIVICCTYNAKNFVGQIKMVKEIMVKNKNVILIPMRVPYDFLELKDVKACILPYEYTENSIVSLAKVLAGEIKGTGSNPVSLDNRVKGI